MSAGITNLAFEEVELNGFEAVQHGEDSAKNSKKPPTESTNCLTAYRTALAAFHEKYNKAFHILGIIFFNAAVAVYLVFASLHWAGTKGSSVEWCNGYGMLLILLALIYGGLLYFHVIKPFLFRRLIAPCCRPLVNGVTTIQNTRYGSITMKAVIIVAAFAALIAFLVIDTQDSRERLRSGLGIVIILLFGFLFSKYPGHINWRPVLCGMFIQFIFALITIRWEFGRAIFQCLSQKIAAFLDFGKSGASFIFSEGLVTDGVFAFSVLPIIFYFSFLIQILYYLGTMQWVISKLGSTLQGILGTTMCESITCAANIFIGMSESPLLIGPYISKLTASELHAIMCSGFASVSGTVLAAYIGFGANPTHLITASVMSAPASLCFSKLFYPEVEKSLTSSDNIQLEKSKDSGILDAATKGAVSGIPVVLGIIANITAFVSFIALVNSILGWLGILVGFEGLTVEVILSKVFMPLSWIMGVPWEMCEDVATLIGLKTVVNEFVAYQKLGEYKKQNRIYGRAEAIATYAICGFSNPGSVGIMISMLSTLAPEKRGVITTTIARAFVAGSAVSFMTASIAGMLTNDDFFQSNVNGTVASDAISEMINSTILS